MGLAADMIGIDTNVLVRFVVADDARQAAAARMLMEELSEDSPGYLCREVVVELVWVLERTYRYDRVDVARVLTGLLEARELVVEEAGRVGLAISRYVDGGAGFSDQMILLAGAAADCEATATFDKRAADAKGGRLLSR